MDIFYIWIMNVHEIIWIDSCFLVSLYMVDFSCLSLNIVHGFSTAHVVCPGTKNMDSVPGSSYFGGESW